PDAQASLGARVVAVEAAARDGPWPHAPVRAVAGAPGAALERLARRARRRREVQVRPAADGVGGHDLHALALDEVVDLRQVADVHRLLEVRVAEAPAALEHDYTARV